MSVLVQHDEENNVYNLTGEVDGVPIVFASVPGDTVTARVAAVHAEQAESGAAANTATSGAGGGGGGGFSAADFTDNGDGTFTRKSDGATGRFTPSGFEPA